MNNVYHQLVVLSTLANSRFSENKNFRFFRCRRCKNTSVTVDVMWSAPTRHSLRRFNSQAVWRTAQSRITFPATEEKHRLDDESVSCPCFKVHVRNSSVSFLSGGFWKENQGERQGYMYVLFLEELKIHNPKHGFLIHPMGRGVRGAFCFPPSISLLPFILLFCARLISVG